MYRFYVNGKEYQEDGDGKLLPFLRNVCKLKSVKDGCSEGACGTCHVLIDGKPMKACVPEQMLQTPSRIISVAVQAIKRSLTGSFLQGNICGKGFLPILPIPGRWEREFQGLMYGKRYWEPVNIRMTWSLKE